MAMVFGAAATFTAQVAGPFSGGGGSDVKIGTITLPASGWKGAVSPYAQEVAFDAVSVSSKVDLQADSETLEALRMAGIALVAANDEGTVTVYAFGDKPGSDLTVQATVTEVIA